MNLSTKINNLLTKIDTFLTRRENMKKARKKIKNFEKLGVINFLKFYDKEKENFVNGTASPHNLYLLTDKSIKKEFDKKYSPEILAGAIYMVSDKIAGAGLPAYGGCGPLDERGTIDLAKRNYITEILKIDLNKNEKEYLKIDNKIEIAYQDLWSSIKNR